MLSKNQIKNILSLHSKKNREEEKLFIIEGEKLVSEAFNSEYSIQNIYATKQWIEENKETINYKKQNPIEISESELTKISLLNSPAKVLAICKQKNFDIDFPLLSSTLNLYLDDIRDPGNLGTIIRLAHWFGIPQIMCSPETVEFFNPKVVQSTMGSIFHVKLITHDLSDVIFTLSQKKQEIQVFGAYLDGENIYQKKNFTSGILVIGNESNGIQEKNKKNITDRIKIPPASKTHAESLNAAMATSIFLSEYLRRKK